MTAMRSYGFGEGFIENIAMMNENTTSFVQIKGNLSTPFQFVVERDRDVSSV